MSRGSEGLPGTPAGLTPGRPTLPGPAIRARNPPNNPRGLVGVVWGEGEGAANQGGPAAGVAIPDWIERLVRAVWRRLFVHGGEA